MACSRQRGSHSIFTKTGFVTTLSNPKHNGIARGALRALIATAGVSLDEFLKALS